MNTRRIARWLVPVVFVISLLAPLSVTAQGGSYRYESQPDRAALYLGDMAYIYDELTLAGGVEAQIVLPRTALLESLIVRENGRRVRGVRHVQPGLESGPAVTLDAVAGDEPRTITLEYLASGAGWQPIYDMTVLENNTVQFAFDAVINNYGLPLEDTEIRLVAGTAGLQGGLGPNMTATQANIGYADVPTVVTGGPVEINHVYDVDTLSLEQGGTMRWNLVDAPLSVRKLLVWDARFGQRADVIYKIQNSGEEPFVSGSVYAYQDGLYVGMDAIEWTPAGSEGSVTVSGMSAVRVRRTESIESVGGFRDERYLHTVSLAITNHSGETAEMTVLDEWNRGGETFNFSVEPQRQGNNVLRWELKVDAGQSTEITYTFITE